MFAKTRGVERICEEAGFAVLNQLGHTAHPVGDDGQAARHRLENHIRQVVFLGSEEQNVAGGVEKSHVLLGEKAEVFSTPRCIEGEGLCAAGYNPPLSCRNGFCTRRLLRKFAKRLLCEQSAFSLFRKRMCAKHDVESLRIQIEAPSRFLLGHGSERLRIYAVRNDFDAT